MAGTGQYREKRPSSPHVGHDRSAPSERVVRSSLALLRRLQHPGVDGDRLPKGTPAVRQDPGEPPQSPSSRCLGEPTAVMEGGGQKSPIQKAHLAPLPLPTLP